MRSAPKRPVNQSISQPLEDRRTARRRQTDDGKIGNPERWSVGPTCFGDGEALCRRELRFFSGHPRSLVFDGRISEMTILRCAGSEMKIPNSGDAGRRSLFAGPRTVKRFELCGDPESVWFGRWVQDLSGAGREARNENDGNRPEWKRMEHRYGPASRLASISRRNEIDRTADLSLASFLCNVEPVESESTEIHNSVDTPYPRQAGSRR